MNMKKLFAGVLVSALAVTSLVGCTKQEAKPVDEKGNAAVTSEANQENTDKQVLHIDVIAKGFQHQFWKAVELGSQKAAKEFGVEITFQGPDNETAIEQQLQYIEAAIAKKPAAICLAALDTKAALGAIKNAQEAGIPIVGFDSGVPDAPEGAVKANAATDNYAAGQLAADETYILIADKLKGEGVKRIGVVSQESNSQSIVSRTKGFVDKMSKLIGTDKVSVEGHDSLKNEKEGAQFIIDVMIPAELKEADGVAVAASLLEKEDLIAIYGSNEFAANVIITANEGLDKIGADKVIAVGFDAGKKLLDAVRSGLFSGAVTQDPVSIGYQAVKLAYEASQGKEVKDVDTGAKWYNASNMEDEAIKPCLYE